ncbi:endonuclease/exonuclease/phosphatase family protein [Niallia oryzisoli]|uniref:Endonuclease/exonuclease/phosphatase family protein n=1 Tax=Niallia oryzisoli TaxID=1737571 RepID=A0ABZ2CDJ3_9BACI
MKDEKLSIRSCMLALLLLMFTLIATAPISLAAEKKTNKSQMELIVMTYNIFAGGSRSTPLEIAASIKFANADIIGIQEPAQSLPGLAELLGFYHNERMSILSRYPIIDHGDKDFVYVEVEPGKVVAVSNVHLPAAPYMPYQLRDQNYTVDLVIRHEKTQERMNGIASRLESLPKIAEKEIPVFLTGDFNTPSHLDWTEEARTNHYGFVVEWPISKKLEQLGFLDSYRDIYPDPVAKPAYTWTSGLPGREPPIEPNEKHDRIDFIYHAGPVKTLDSQVVGESGPYSDLSMAKWPSDHRAVVSMFEIIPVDKPWNISPDKRTYSSGDPITVSFNGSSKETDWIGLYHVQKRSEEGSIQWKYASSNTVIPSLHKSEGVVSFTDTASLSPGIYKILFLADNGYRVLNEKTISILPN